MDILYTTTAQIRACLLIADEDLPDVLFDQALYEAELTVHLSAWLPNHATLINTYSDLLTSYCAYWGAKKVASTTVLSIPQQVADGKNSLQRWPDLTALLAYLDGTLADLRRQLKTASQQGATVGPRQFTAVGLGVDPVTG